MRILALLALLTACKKTTPVEAPSEPSAAGPTADTPLPVDPSVRSGVLDNGMRYFIEQNGVPENKAVLRLAVDAGSIQEDDDQLGIAHFLEHMAFNGTKSFPSNDLIKVLEGVGTKFGPHLNAHTSFEETVYKLTVPTDDPAVFAQGLQVLEEWACCMTLDPEEIEKERGVVLEEWRTRDGVRRRQVEVAKRTLFFGSRYAERFPIGTAESLETFDPAVVGRFFEDWYRPELMAVVVVGDVDVDAVEATIRERFGAIPISDGGPERVEYDIPAHDEPIYEVFVDAELPATSGGLQAKLPRNEPATYGEWRERTVSRLALTGLSERLSAIARDPESPVLRLGPYESFVTPHVLNQQVWWAAKEGRAAEAHELALTELERFRRHGVTAAELDRAAKATIEFMDKYEREAEDTHSRQAADEIVRHFLNQEAMPGTLEEAAITRDVVRDVTLDEVNAWARTFLGSGSFVTVFNIPEKEGVTPPTVEDIRAIEARVADLELEPPAEEATVDALVPTPEPGGIAERDDTFVEGLQMAGFTLSNGTRVYARKTDWKPGEVKFRAYRRGGQSAVPDADRQFAVGWMADRVRSESGVGEHDHDAVVRFLHGKTMSVGVSFDDYETEMSGNAGTKDLAAALQLAHAYHTAPAFTERGVGVTKAVWTDWLKNYFNDPERQFSEKWDITVEPDDPRSPQIELADLERLTAEGAEAIWTRSLGAPQEWTWVFVGDLPEDFEDTVAQWLGSVPEAEPGYPVKDRGYRRPGGEVREVIEFGSADRASYRTELYGKLPEGKVGDPEWEANFDAFGDILRVRLRERLREDLGGVYGVSAWAGFWWIPEEAWRVRVEFHCDPDRVEELETAMQEVFDELVNDGVEASYVDAELAKNRESYEDAQKNNGFWLNSFTSLHLRGEDPTRLLRYLEHDATLTPAKVQEMAKTYLKAEDRVTVVLMPAGDAGDSE